MKMWELKTTRTALRIYVASIMKRMEKEHLFNGPFATIYSSSMQFFRATVFYFLLPFLAAADSGQTGLSETQQHFRNLIAARLRRAEKENAAVVVGDHGWLCLAANLRFLSLEKFWGDAASKVNRSRQPQWSDPIPAIVDFNQQLEQRGIRLLLVPVPPKAAIYPDEIFPESDLHGADSAPFLHRFYDELRSNGIEVLDLTQLFVANRANEHGTMFCKTDSHWSGIGCVLAAQAIAEKIRARLASQPSRKDYGSEWKKVFIEGDLQKLLGKRQTDTREELSVRSVMEKNSGAPVTADANSSVLLLGDSHVLVFHDFLAERAGLLDQLTFELGFAPDVIGTRGSAATAVRINLYRHILNHPSYLTNKKVIVWCFAAHEFTETEQGWVPEPVAK